ncbi:S-adenosyl-L-methionine-dependent methyltransferase [Xylogone sp. PMI_703]|nr:S-adenosyl-L-methionine-dependent methyltransferase [Xylogone sp. PMI_703]
MSKGNERFNAMAAEWDSNPFVNHASATALQTLVTRFPRLQKRHDNPDQEAGLDVLEVGCGTGLLSFMMAPYVRSLTAVDTAEGMIEAFKLKLGQRPDINNLLPVYAMLEDANDERIRADPLAPEQQGKEKELPPRKFDLIISHLVLHHIPSLPQILSVMHGCLKPGGHIALTDFEDFGPEAKRFHPESRMDGVERHGIRRKDMEEMIKNAGFEDVEVSTAFELEKMVEEAPGKGIIAGVSPKMTFPFLICIGRK